MTGTPDPDGIYRDARLEVRITTAGKAAIMKQSEQEGVPFSDMVRTLLGRGLAASPKPRPPIRPKPKPGR